MGQIRVTISDDIEKEFSELAYKLYYGEYKTRFMKVAVEEAMRMWIKSKKGESHSKGKVKDAFLGLSGEAVVEVEGVKVRFSYGKISIPLEVVEGLIEDEEFRGLLDKYGVYYTINVIDDSNWISFIPKIVDEFSNTTQKRLKLKEWMSKNMKNFLKDLISMSESKGGD